MQFHCIIILIVNSVVCRGPHHPRGHAVVKHHVHYRPTRGSNQKLTQDEQLLHDKEHIQVIKKILIAYL